MALHLMNAAQFFKEGKDEPLVTVRFKDTEELLAHLRERNPDVGPFQVNLMFTEQEDAQVCWENPGQGVLTTGYRLKLVTESTTHRTASSTHIYPRLPKPALTA